MRRLPLIAACSAAGMLVLAGEAVAQSREFYCGEENVVKLKVIDKKTISAGPIAGRTLALMQVPGKPMVYANGKTSLEIASDQNRIAIRVVGEEPLACVFPAPDGTAERTAGDDTGAGKPAGEKPVANKPVVKTTTTATAEPASKGFAAKSWGGVVRSGPGMEFKQVASLKEGEKITVIEDAGVEMNGYRWYKIRFGAGRTGYQWGGILCPVGKTVAGAFQSC